MGKTTFKIFVVLLCGFLFIGMASTNSERLQTAKKFKEIDRLANKLQDTHQIPMQDIMPKIKEAERHFKQREYQKAGQLLDGIIAELKRTLPLTPASDNFDTTKINTSGWQDTPFISADGKKLFFTYSPHDFLRAKKPNLKKS